MTAPASVDIRVPCGGDDHVVRLTTADAECVDHADEQGEQILGLLGGGEPTCTVVAAMWRALLAGGELRAAVPDRGASGRIFKVPHPPPAWLADDPATKGLARQLWHHRLVHALPAAAVKLLRSADLSA